MIKLEKDPVVRDASRKPTALRTDHGIITRPDLKNLASSTRFTPNIRSILALAVVHDVATASEVATWTRLSVDNVERWVAAYREHGQDSMRLIKGRSQRRDA